MARKKKSSAPAGQRQLRVGEEMRHALAEILREHHLADPDLAGKIITVTEVRISPDLRNATAFVLPLGGTETDKTVQALNRAAGYFRGELGARGEDAVHPHRPLPRRRDLRGSEPDREAAARSRRRPRPQTQATTMRGRGR